MLVDIMVDIEGHRTCAELAGHVMMTLIPGSALVFLVDVDEETAFKRKQDIPDISYLRIRRASYHRFANLENVHILREGESCVAFRNLGFKLSNY